MAHHTDQQWVLLYVQRWLKAPQQRPDGSLVARDRGSPQGSAISPLLANLFMHYAFDAWMDREFPGAKFERYCDDAVIHCRSEAEAHHVRDAVARRLADYGDLELHPDKARIVYCKDGRRRGSYEHTSFTFLGYGFRVRKVRTSTGSIFPASTRPSATKPPSASEGKSAPGGCTCAADRPSSSSHGRSTP